MFTMFIENTSTGGKKFDGAFLVRTRMFHDDKSVFPPLPCLGRNIVNNVMKSNT